MVCLFTGLPLLDLTDTEAEANWTWMITYGAPIATSLASICLMLCIYSEEPIEFCIAKGDKEQAIKLIKKAYAEPE
jgi:hypothetical protein